MKVVLFCGGQGLRIRDYSDAVPKPMVPVGNRPILWHLMRYYAHFGHREFILCLGYKSNVIKDYFLNYNETITNDFVLSNGGRAVKMLGSDNIADWSITFVDTGLDASIGQRLMAVREHVEGDEVFLANYADNVTDASLDDMVAAFRAKGSVASLLSVRPSQSFHVVQVGPDSMVRGVVAAPSADIWINGGFFVLRREIFDYMRPGEDLVLEPFQRLIRAGRLSAYRHDGFFACMDTFKERMVLEDLHARDQAPWQVWRRRPLTVARPAGGANGALHVEPAGANGKVHAEVAAEAR
jgi:glucose-1-phosphate cytidylyltransferase